MNEFLGKVHFWTSLIFINGVFFPMFLQGMAGVHRRWYDGGGAFDQISKVPVFGKTGLHWNEFMFYLRRSSSRLRRCLSSSISSGASGKARRSARNPWDGTTLEWDAPSPPPHGNFDKELPVYRGPYEYSVPGRETRISLRRPSRPAPQRKPEPEPALVK